jgi:hypothetical protein
MDFPSDLMTRSSGWIQISCENENGKGTNDTVRLPLPPSLAFSDGMSYENAEMGAVSAMIMDGKTMEDVAAGLSAYGAKFDGLTIEAAKDIGGKLLSKMGVKTAQQRMQSTPNPNTRSLFKSVNHRSFQFQFDLVATESSDKVLIENILEFFRVNMYPADENPQIPLMYAMPNKFRIAAFLKSPKGPEKELENFRFEDSYLTSASTVLDGTTVLAESGYNPWVAKTTLSLTFMEYRTLTTKDIKAGF